MASLQLLLICISIQWINILQVLSAPVSDIKSHTHYIGDNNIKVTSHVNVGLGDEQNDATGASSPLQNHAIEVSEDAAMHIKIDIGITPQMLVGQMESEETENPGPKKNDQLTDWVAAKMDTLENISKITEKKEQSINENTDKTQHLDGEADSDQLDDETKLEDESEADQTVPKAVPEAGAKTLEVANKNTEQGEGRSDNKNEAVNPLEKEIAAEKVKEDSHALEAKHLQDSSPAKAVESLEEGHDGDDMGEDDAEDEEDLGDIEYEDEDEDNHPEEIIEQGAQVPITENKLQVRPHVDSGNVEEEEEKEDDDDYDFEDE